MPKTPAGWYARYWKPLLKLEEPMKPIFRRLLDVLLLFAYCSIAQAQTNSIDFGDVRVGDQSAPMTVSGFAGVTDGCTIAVGGFAIDGENPDDFFIAESAQQQTANQGRVDWRAAIVFRPGSEGEKWGHLSVTLIVNGCSHPTRMDASFVGRGVAEAGPTGVTPTPIVGDPDTPVVPPIVSQSAYAVGDGALPAAVVDVAATGTLGAASLTAAIDVREVLALQPASRFAAGYNVYVAALVPGRQLSSSSDRWFMNARSSQWQALTFPLATFMENIAAGMSDQKIVIRLLTNSDLSRLVGTEFYLGLGYSDQEMLAAKRYRGIYKVQASQQSPP